MDAPAQSIGSATAENYPPKIIADHLIRLSRRSETIKHIKEHYDNSAEFFMLILDSEYHFYSCADFLHATDILECAQRRKGRMVHQYGTLLRPGTPATYLLGQLIFSGSERLTLEEQVGAATKAGFVPTHDSRHDYRSTWKAWYNNLARNAERAVSLVCSHEYNKYPLLFVFAWLFSENEYAEVHHLR